MVIDAFLKEHPEFELVAVKDKVRESTCDGIMFEGCECESIHLTRRFYPHISRGEGQFAAVLKSTLPPSSGARISKASKEKIDPVVFEFLDDTLVSYDKSKVRMYNGNPVYFRDDFDIKKGTAFSCGVTIGEIKKNYIQPHHQFFMAMGKDFRRKLELDCNGDTIRKYLHGEEIEADCEKGWAVVTTAGCTVGGIKVANGKGKNHYPKGLRLNF